MSLTFRCAHCLVDKIDPGRRHCVECNAVICGACAAEDRMLFASGVAKVGSLMKVIRDGRAGRGNAA